MCALLWIQDYKMNTFTFNETIPQCLDRTMGPNRVAFYINIRSLNQHMMDLASDQCLSQDLETGCLKLAVVQFLGVQIFKGDHNILILQP